MFNKNIIISINNLRKTPPSSSINTPPLVFCLFAFAQKAELSRSGIDLEHQTTISIELKDKYQ